MQPNTQAPNQAQPYAPPADSQAAAPMPAQPLPPLQPQPGAAPVAAGQQQRPTDSQPQGEKRPVNPNSTQGSLLISEIRDNVAILRDGSFRAVVACKSINFDLMSSREREGIEYSYQNFLNSLYFPVQIFIRSQRVDIGPYIDRLVQIRRGQDNMLLNVLMDDYINFIDVLSQEANIMDKSFFITVPYFPAGDLSSVKKQAQGFFGKIFAKQQAGPTTIDEATYIKAMDEVKNRVDAVMSGLFQMGVQSVQLNTKELADLYYNFYNPDTAIRQPLGDFENMAATFVRKGDGQAPLPTTVQEETI